MNEFGKRLTDSAWDETIALRVIQTKRDRRSKTIKVTAGSGSLFCIALLFSVTFFTNMRSTGPGLINTQIYGTVTDVYEEDIYVDESTEQLIMSTLAVR